MAEYNFKYSDEQRDALIRQVFEGVITIDTLPEDLIEAIVKTLTQAVEVGFGEIVFGEIDEKLIELLKENVYMFSTAKTFSEISEMQFSLVEDGNIMPFNAFKEKATEIFTRYQGGKIIEANEEIIKPGWLEAEYNTAIAQANNAKKWNQIESQKEALPYLRFSTAGSPCEECLPLEGITLPVDDPFWDDYAPEIHYNCRCVLEQVDDYEGKDTESKHEDIDNAIEAVDMPDEFRFNPGKTGKIYSDSHPYYQGFDKKEFQDSENFTTFRVLNKLKKQNK